MRHSEVYKAIRDRLLSGMTIAYVDMQKGQFVNKSQNYPVPLPCCLIEFRQVNWSSSTGGQIGETVISIYMYIDHVTDSYNESEHENKTIELLDKLDNMYERLGGYSNTCKRYYFWAASFSNCVNGY